VPLPNARLSNDISTAMPSRPTYRVSLAFPGASATEQIAEGDASWVSIPKRLHLLVRRMRGQSAE
jgi:hypothetical protein